MAKKPVESVFASKASDDLLNIAQACNEFKVVGIIRKHAEKKYADSKFTKWHWGNIFKTDRII